MPFLSYLCAMARPEKDDAVKKKMRRFYSSDEEYTRVENEAKRRGLSTSAYVLMMALSGETKPPKP